MKKKMPKKKKEKENSKKEKDSGKKEEECVWVENRQNNWFF